MTSPATTARPHAWADESGSVHALDPGTYILAATLTPIDREDDIRRTMQQLRLRQAKVHWRDESPRRQRAITAAIADLQLRHIAVVRRGDPNDTLKRRRNKSLQRLLPELGYSDVAQATFESRGPADDQRDLRLVQVLRSQQVLDPGLRINHAPGPSEPLLWVPDAICGAITSARTGNREHLDTLAGQVTLITI